MLINRSTGRAHLGALAERSFARKGDHDALIFEGRTFRSGELLERSRRLAGGLRTLGVEPGDRVMVVMDNCPEVGITYNAIWRAGAVVTPVIFLVTAPELRHMLVDSGAVAVVTTADHVGKVVEAATGVETVQHVVVADAGARTGADAEGPTLVPFAEVETDSPLEIVGRDDHDLAALMYTGGTTGRSKGVELTHHNLWSCTKASHEATAHTGPRRGLSPLPISHAFGMVVTVGAMHAEEPGLSVLMRWFDPVQWLDLAQRHRIERAALVPAMLHYLLAQPLEDTDLSALRTVSVGGAPLPTEALTEFEGRVPGVEVHQGYGCTESGGVITTTPVGARKIGTVGVPIPGYEVRIVDDLGQPLPAGDEGEIIVRSEGIMRGYRNAPVETAAALREGWLFTGDIGRFDSDGYLTVVDRKKDLIIRGGFNIYPRDVEDALLEHPAVAMAAVVGRPDPRLGEEVVGFVALRPGGTATTEDLIAFARTRLAANKYPREVHVLAQLPLTSVGKLDRKRLRAEVRTSGRSAPATPATSPPGD